MRREIKQDTPPAFPLDRIDEMVPRTRSECECSDVRPCPFVRCKYNLLIDVSDSGTIRYNFPAWDAPDSCALDVAEYDGCTLEEVGRLMNITRERVRQIEEAAITKLNFAAEQLGHGTSDEISIADALFEWANKVDNGGMEAV
jgi:hypothetical protein